MAAKVKVSSTLKALFATVGAVLLWYTFSIGLTFYNRWLFKDYGLHFPFSVTTVHMMTNWTLCWMTRIAQERISGRARPVLSWWHTLTKVLPCALAAALDIGLSNSSLLFITVTLYTMAKSSSIIFLLLFAILFKLERFKWNLVLVVVCISGGLLLFSFGSTSVDPIGLVMILCAALCSGLRWTLVQYLLQGRKSHHTRDRSDVEDDTHDLDKHVDADLAAKLARPSSAAPAARRQSPTAPTVAEQLDGPIDTLYHLTPAMACCLLPISLVVEGPALFSSTLLHADYVTAIETFGALFFGSFLAFLMNFAEYLLLYKTSGLALSVAGILKDVCTIGISALVLQEDSFTTVNLVGSVVVFAGIFHFHYIKYTEFHRTTDHRSSHAELAAMEHAESSHGDVFLVNSESQFRSQQESFPLKNMLFRPQLLGESDKRGLHAQHRGYSRLRTHESSGELDDHDSQVDRDEQADDWEESSGFPARGGGMEFGQSKGKRHAHSGNGSVSASGSLSVVHLAAPKNRNTFVDALSPLPTSFDSRGDGFRASGFLRQSNSEASIRRTHDGTSSVLLPSSHLSSAKY